MIKINFKKLRKEIDKIVLGDNWYLGILFGICFIEFFSFTLSGYLFGEKDYLGSCISFILAVTSALLSGELIRSYALMEVKDIALKGGEESNGIQVEKESY